MNVARAHPPAGNAVQDLPEPYIAGRIMYPSPWEKLELPAPTEPGQAADPQKTGGNIRIQPVGQTNETGQCLDCTLRGLRGYVVDGSRCGPPPPGALLRWTSWFNPPPRSRNRRVSPFVPNCLGLRESIPGGPYKAAPQHPSIKLRRRGRRREHKSFDLAGEEIASTGPMRRSRNDTRLEGDSESTKLMFIITMRTGTGRACTRGGFVV